MICIRKKFASQPQLLKSVLALFSSNMASSALGAVGGVVVARFLGPETTGAFRSFSIPLTYLAFLHLGTFDGLWRQMPYYHGKEMPEKVAALASAAGAWNFLVSAIVSSGFICCALYSLWRRDLHSVLGWSSQAVCCWGIFYAGYLCATYRTLNNFVALSRIQMTQACLNFALIFLLPFLKFPGLCLRAASQALLGVLLCQRYRPLKVAIRFDRESLQELVRIGLPFSIFGSLYTSVWLATESALLLSFGGVTALGFLTVATALREGMNVLPMAVYQVMTPRVVATYAAEGSVIKANTRSLELTAWLTGAVVVAILIVSYLLGIVLPLVIPKYEGSLPLVRVFLWFAAVQAASLPLNALVATGKSWLYGRGVLVGLVVFPLATYCLFPSLGGVLAVAVGSLLGRVARTVVAYVEIYRLARCERAGVAA